MKSNIFLAIFVVCVVGLVGLAVGSTPVPQNAFRIKTMGHYFNPNSSFPTVVSVPDLDINLIKTAGTGTTGFKTEFDTGGQYVSSGEEAEFDAINAVLPADWAIKVKPGHSVCSNTDSVEFGTAAGQSHTFTCSYDVHNPSTVNPSTVDVSSGETPPSKLRGQTDKGFDLFGEPQNQVARYYKYNQTTQLFEFTEEKPVYPVDPKHPTDPKDGSVFYLDLPNLQNVNPGLTSFRVLIFELGVIDYYLSHTDFVLVKAEEPIEPIDPTN